MKFFKSSKSFMAAAPRVYPEEAADFMACTLRWDMTRRGSSKALYKLGKVVGSNQGIRHFKMHEDGIIQISGCVNANMLLYKIGKLEKYVEMLWWQHGQCSSNLDGPDHRYFTGAQAYPGYGGAPSYDRGYAVGY
ncbi:uncharacterized protein [Coffea arabica]|uniref:Uncharacterized protein isoform X2 n=1 Tax=Coffea arabica TaxID=13443 RepID=A0ABM4V8U8_COFAR